MYKIGTIGNFNGYIFPCIAWAIVAHSFFIFMMIYMIQNKGITSNDVNIWKLVMAWFEASCYSLFRFNPSLMRKSSAEEENRLVSYQ